VEGSERGVGGCGIEDGSWTSFRGFKWRLVGGRLRFKAGLRLSDGAGSGQKWSHNIGGTGSSGRGLGISIHRLLRGMEIGFDSGISI
jgi:hypothetical protein